MPPICAPNEYESDAAGRVIQKLLANGRVAYDNYDAAGPITSLLNVDPDVAPLATLEYTYDDNTNIIQIARGHQGGQHSMEI